MIDYAFQEFPAPAPSALMPVPSMLDVEEKQDPQYGVVAQFFSPGQPIWSSRDYRTFVSNGYRRCATVYNCVNKIAGAAAGIRWRLWTDRTMSREITQHPLLDLWNAPNALMGTGALVEKLFGFWHLAGNAYLYANRPNENEPPVELWPLRPDLVKIVAGNGDIAGYVLGWGTPGARDFEPQEIMHTKFHSYDDDFYGLSPVEVAMYLVDQQNEGNAWNTALMQNAGKPASAFFAKGYLTVEQRNQVRQEILKRYSGKRNAGFPLILEADMTWQAMSMAPYELDWLQSREMNTREIASIFDVAPELVGDSAGKTFANQKEAKQSLYTENVLPKMDRFRDHVNVWLVPMYADLLKKGAFFTYDKDDIEALADIRQAQKKATSDQATSLWNTGQCDLYTAQTMQEGVLPDENARGIYKIGAILVRSEDLPIYAQQALQKPSAPPSPTPENAPPPATMPPAPTPAKRRAAFDVDSMLMDSLIQVYLCEKFGLDEQDERLPMFVSATKRALKERLDALSSSSSSSQRPVDAHHSRPTDRAGRYPARTTPPLDSTHRAPAPGLAPARSRPIGTKALDLTTTEQKQAYFDQMEALREKWSEEATSRLADYFEMERKAVVAALTAGDHAATVEPEVAAAVQAQAGQLQDILVTVYQDVGTDVGNDVGRAFDEAKRANGRYARKATSVDMLNAEVLNYLQNMAASQVSLINDTTLAALRAALVAGVAAGESIPKLAKRIDDLYLQQIIPNRSTVIARTETLSASNYGAMQAAQQSGLTLNKVWLATGDSRTRKDHADADGQEVALDEPFDVGGYQMMQPGDSSMGAPADEVVQCRCTVYFKRVSQDDSSKALIIAPRAFTSVRAFMEAVGV